MQIKIASLHTYPPYLLALKPDSSQHHPVCQSEILLQRWPIAMVIKLIPLLYPGINSVGYGWFHVCCRNDSLEAPACYLVLLISTFSLSIGMCHLPNPAAWRERGRLRERKSEVYLNVIYFSCRFVGWRRRDKCKLVVYEALLSAGKAALLWGSWLSVLGRLHCFAA